MYPLPLLPLAICTPPLALADIRTHRLPNRWNAGLAVAGLVAHAIVSLQASSWRPIGVSLAVGTGGLLAMWLLQLLVRGGLGFGDVKLVGALGCVLADEWLLFGSVFAAFVAASVFVLPRLGRRYTGTSRIAFGPFILLGAWMMALIS